MRQCQTTQRRFPRRYTEAAITAAPRTVPRTFIGCFDRLFLLFSAFAAVVWLIATGTVPRLGAHIKTQVVSMMEKTKKLLGNRNHLHCYGMMVLQMFAGFTVIAFFNPYLVANVQFLEKDITGNDLMPFAGS